MLEVWGGGRLLRDLSVPAPLHGAVYNDGWFAAGAAWSPDEQRIAYVAEARPAPPPVFVAQAKPRRPGRWGIAASVNHAQMTASVPRSLLCRDHLCAIERCRRSAKGS